MKKLGRPRTKPQPKVLTAGTIFTYKFIKTLALEKQVAVKDIGVFHTVLTPEITVYNNFAKKVVTRKPILRVWLQPYSEVLEDLLNHGVSE